MVPKLNDDKCIDESQINLMAQPHLLEYICNVCHVFPQYVEIHRHVARCLANLALYGELLLHQIARIVSLTVRA